MTPPLLQVEALTSGYGRTSVLREVSLQVAEGEIVVLLGPNGAGKSTLFNTLLGVVPTRSGQVRLAGVPTSGLQTREIVRQGMIGVPERRQLFGSMTVEENLLLGAFARADRGPKPMRAAELDEQYGFFPRLGERRRQMAGQLSGGEQQMVAISRALMGRPRLLLLDEPSLGLAPLVIRQIFEKLVQLRRQGTTILLSEQNARAALGIADRGYVMETGRVVLSGKASMLLEDVAVQQAYLGGGSGGGQAMESRIRQHARTIRDDAARTMRPE